MNQSNEVSDHSINYLNLKITQENDEKHNHSPVSIFEEPNDISNVGVC